MVALVAAACGDPEEGDEADGEIWSVDPEPLVTIGRLEGDARYLFQRVADARLLPDGRIAVADRGMANVRVFGPDGSFEHAMGRAGEGPGEFTYIRSMDVRAPDTLVVYDSELYRFTTYLADGSLVSTVDLAGEGGRAPELALGRFGDGDMVVASTVHTERDPAEVTADPMQLDRFAPDGAFIGALGTASGLTRHGAVGPMPFSPYLHSFVHRDTVYWTDGVDSMVVLAADGATARIIRLPSVAVEYADAEARLRARLDDLDRPEWAPRLDDAPTVPPVPDVADVLLDDRGRFWMKRYEPGTDSNWVVFFTRRAGGAWWIVEPDGDVTATVELSPDFTPLNVRGDRLVGVSTDDLGVERVVVWRFGPT